MTETGREQEPTHAGGWAIYSESGEHVATVSDVAAAQEACAYYESRYGCKYTYQPTTAKPQQW